jgi:thymidylate kinase
VKTRLLILEGADATGTSTHARALAAALCAAGITARAFHHPHAPADATPWQRALHYATARAALVAALDHDAAPAVVVCDRWHQSTEVEAYAIGRTAPDLARALDRLTSAEQYALPQPVLVAVLHANPLTLNARMAARGETPTHADGLRRWAYDYETIADLRVSTDAPVADVTARLLAAALHALATRPEAP